MNTLFCPLAIVFGLFVSSTTLWSQDDYSIAGLRAKALQALNEGNHRTAIENADAMVRQAGNDPRTSLQAADIYLRSGKYRWSVRLFDRYLESDKQALPELWQRGIALYFMRDYEKAAKQFEIHRTANPNDVENAAWHFLCVAKAQSPSEAKGQLLPAPGDPRVPMEEVMAMLKTGNRQAITDKVAQLEKNSQERVVAEFYGDFYLGLYADAMGQREQAKKMMQKAAGKAPRNYMGDVAKVYAKFLGE